MVAQLGLDASTTEYRGRSRPSVHRVGAGATEKEIRMIFGIITMLAIIVIGVIFVRMVSRDPYK